MNAPPLPTAEQWRRWGVDPAWSRTVDVAGHDGATHRWHLLDRTPDATDVSARPTIVCVHGNPTWSILWRDVVQRLGDRYRVIAVDQLGMGWSSRSGHRRYATRVRDLGDLIDTLDVDGPIVIVGQDWGGAVAMGWAVDHPDRLAGMVLCNTGIAVPAGRRAPWLIRLAASGPITDLVGRRTRIFVDGTIGLSYRRLAPEVRDALRAPYRAADQRPNIAEFVADVPFTAAHPSSAAIADVAERLATVTAPVLLAWGATDPVFDDSFAADLYARLPHAERHRFASVGHLSPLEADVAGVIDAWLGTTAPPAAVVADVAADTDVVPTWGAIVERAHDDDVAIVDSGTGERVSFAQLHDRVMAVAADLAARGVRPGDRVAMLVPPGIDLVVAVYGVWRAGGVTVIADRGLGLRGLRRAVRGAHVQWVIGEPRGLTAARVLRWAPRAQTVAVTDLGTTGAAKLPPAPGPDDDAAVLFTSGATGPAKGVRYRHRQLAAQRDVLARTYAITRDDRLVAAFAPFALYGPALGIASTIPDVDVTKPGTLTADALAESVRSLDATIVFASPAALANVIRTSSVGDARLGRVRLVLSAGAPVPAATLRAMSERCPAAELHTPYGMTECLPVADTSLVEIDRAGAGIGVFVGPPVSGAEVMVAPLGFDAGRPVTAVAAGTTGELLVRARWCSDGYDQLWAVERDARPVDTSGVVWHRSGDVGHVDADGCVWVEGRSVHVVHAVDGPLTPVPVEVAVERLDGIDRCAAVGVGPVGCQQLVVVVERAGGEGLADDTTAAAVRAAVTSPVAAVLQVSALPVDIRHNTKIDRTAVAAWAADVLAGGRARRPW